MELLTKFEQCKNSYELKEVFINIQKYTSKDCENQKLFEIISEKIKQLYFNQGNLPDIEVLLVSNKLKDFKVKKKDDFWIKVGEYFLAEYKQLSDNKSEKYTYNILIFISDLFIQGYEEAANKLICRTLLLDTRNADKQNEWVRSLEYFFLHVNPCEDITTKAIKELLKEENFFSFSKESQRSIFYWCLHVVWGHKPYMNNSMWMTFQPVLKKLTYKALEKGDISTQMYIHFFAYQILGNLYQTQKEWKSFNDDFNIPESKALESLHVRTCKSEIAKGKKKIVFVKDRIVENSPYKVEYSLFSVLMADENFIDNYELYVLSMGYIDKAPDQIKEVEKLKQLGIQVVSPGQIIHQEDEYYDHLKKAFIIREWFLENEIDIMVGCVNGYDIMNFLFTCRVAPKQIYWSHGNFEYNVEGIDKKITHIPKGYMQTNDIYFERFMVQQYNSLLKYDIKADKEEALLIRSKFKDNILILGSIGRLVKVDSYEYLKIVAKIMDQYPNTIYLACGTGAEQSIKKKIKKLKISERFYFEGWINSRVYSHVIDIYLNTFPEPSGESLSEYLYSNNILKIVDWQGEDSLINDQDRFEKKYILDSSMAIDIQSKKELLYEFNSILFWDKENKKYKQTCERKRYSLNKEEKDILIFGLYIPLKFINDKDIIEILTTFVNRFKKSKIIIFTNIDFLEDDNLWIANNSIFNIVDIKNKNAFEESLDFIISIPNIYSFQEYFFGIKPNIWLYQEELNSSRIQRDLVNSIHTTNKQIEALEQACFSKKHKDEDVYNFVTRAFSSFDVTKQTIQKVLSMGEEKLYDYKINFLNFLIEDKSLLNAYKMRVYKSNYMNKYNDTFKQNRLSISTVDYKIFDC